VILLDTHVWVWWVNEDPQLPESTVAILASSADRAISLFSCWEVAKLLQLNRVALDRPVDEWIAHALSSTGTAALELSIPILIEATRLPQPFHRDPADQIIVATARYHGIPLLTQDRQILDYPHVLHAELPQAAPGAPSQRD
jgi:PIN domain nuclease of toxin-antitoxin system